MKPHQQQRINVLLGKQVAVKDADYNVKQSKIAIGSGGFITLLKTKSVVNTYAEETRKIPVIKNIRLIFFLKK